MRARRLAIGVGIVAAVLAVPVVANATGAADPIESGPLGDHQQPIEDGADMTMTYVPNRGPVYFTPYVQNAGPMPATIVRVVPVGVTVPGSVEVLWSLPFDHDAATAIGLPEAERVAMGSRRNRRAAGRIRSRSPAARQKRAGSSSSG